MTRLFLFPNYAAAASSSSSMAIFRSLKTLISKSKRNPNPNPNFTLSRTFFNLSPSSPSSTQSILYTNPIFIYRRPLLSRYNYFLSPISSVVGPLFLSSPPWKLSQSATPLLLQSDAVSFFKAHAFTFLRKPSSAFPYNLGLQPAANQSLLLVEEKILNNDNNKKKNFDDKCDEVTAAVKVTDNYLNFPNFISLSRLLSGPLLAWMITQEMYSLAFIGLAISGATDWLDGYMARKMGINSVVGSYLDPLADKVLIGFVVLSMVEKGLLHPGLVALVVLRDVALVGGVVYMRASSLRWEWKSWNDFVNLDGTRPQKVEPLFISKVNTVLQLVLVAAALLQPEFGNVETQSYITYLSWLVASTTVSSTVAYGAQYLKNGSTTIRKIS